MSNLTEEIRKLSEKGIGDDIIRKLAIRKTLYEKGQLSSKDWDNRQFNKYGER